MNETNKKTKTPLLLMVSVSSVLLLLLPNAFSSMNTSLQIQTSGSIAYMSPLHVDGIYIRNVVGTIIYLRGAGIYQYAFDPTGWWWPPDGSVWDNHLVWAETSVREHFRIMKSWGMNLIRFHTTAEWWLQDNINLADYGGSGTTSYRYNLKRTCQIASEEGIYVILDMAYVKNGMWHYNTKNPPPHLPFSPYLAYSEEQAVFPNGKQSFIDYWVSVANELKAYPNVIFELYNEPHADGYDVNTVKSDWQDGFQRAINAIRATGATNLIEVQWNWAAVPYTGDNNSLSWIEDYPLIDPLNNILYSTHLYRCFYNPTWGPAYDYQEALKGMIDVGAQHVVQDLQKPLIIGEMGVNMWDSDTGLQQELDWARNILSIANDWGISYAVWDWTITDQWHLIAEPEGLPVASAWGQVLKDAIVQGGTRA